MITIADLEQFDDDVRERLDFEPVSSRNSIRL